MSFKVGDWMFFEFKLSYIKAMELSRITEVSDGGFSTSGHSLEDRVFPLCVKIKNISDNYSDFYTELHKSDFNGMNWPDIHRWFVEHWAETCKVEKFKDVDAEKDFYRKRYSEVRDFVNQFRENYSEMKRKTIGGVNLLRH